VRTARSHFVSLALGLALSPPAAAAEPASASAALGRHEDDGALLATHYCAAMNQPRMKLTPASAGDALVFEFVDGTNLEAHPGRMQRVALSTPDARRQVQSWTFADKDGTSGTMTMELTRADAPAK
jgi:hypothetical protein